MTSGQSRGAGHAGPLSVHAARSAVHHMGDALLRVTLPLGALCVETVPAPSATGGSRHDKLIE